MTYALHLDTAVPRPGRMFEPVQERELHSAALEAAEGLPGTARGLVVVPEFAGPIGVPDFTAYVGPLKALVDRRVIDVPPVVSDIDAGIVSATHVRRASTIQDIASVLGWPITTIEGRMRRLVVKGALTQQRPGYYVRPVEIDTRGRLYAIETKIEDWRKALRQVRTYRVWADAYLLVMSGLSERTSEALADEVRRDQGGLVVDGRWLSRPRISGTAEWRRLQAREQFAVAVEHGLDPALVSRVHS